MTRDVLVLSYFGALLLLSCGGAEVDDTPYGMGGSVAECEYDTIHMSQAGGAPLAVSVNGLPVQEFYGAEKSGPDSVAVVRRRGVAMALILERAGITLDPETPVNCVARDGWDPLRTRLEGDTSRLPTLQFFRDHAYIYVGSPGDKDPLYPTMEGKSLMVDYDLSEDGQVPEYLGGTLQSLSIFRFMMVEMAGEEERGVFELDPVI